jgi:hypothetical protein
MDHQEHRVSTELQGLRQLMDHLELLELMVIFMDLLEHPEPVVKLEHLVRLEHLELMAQVEPQELHHLQEPPVQAQLQELLELLV